MFFQIKKKQKSPLFSLYPQQTCSWSKSTLETFTRCSKLTRKTPKRRHQNGFIAAILVFLLLTLTLCPTFFSVSSIELEQSNICWHYIDLKKMQKTCKTCSVSLFHSSYLQYMEVCKYDSKRTKNVFDRDLWVKLKRSKKKCWHLIDTLNT